MVKWAIYHGALLPLIHANYWLRAKHVLPDRWFWADRLACAWGYFTHGD